MENYFKNKVIFLNVFFTMLIVLAHAKSPERFGMAISWEYPLCYIVGVFCRVATPSFFFLSALLFYKECTEADLGRKLTSRIHTLLIPYIIWNTFFVLVYYALTHIAYFSTKMHMGETALNSIHSVLDAIVHSTHTDLWFVKNLMVYSLCSPLILYILQRRHLLLSTLLVSLFCVWAYEPVHRDLIRWIPIYLIGAMCGYYWNDTKVRKIVNSKQSISTTVAVAFILIVLYVITLTINRDMYLFRFLSPLLIWILVDGCMYNFLREKFTMRRWMKYMFFIYCTHHFVLNVLQKIVVLTCEPTALVINLTFVVTPILTVILLICIANYISNTRIYKVMCGSR